MKLIFIKVVFRGRDRGRVRRELLGGVKSYIILGGSAASFTVPNSSLNQHFCCSVSLELFLSLLLVQFSTVLFSVWKIPAYVSLSSCSSKEWFFQKGSQFMKNRIVLSFLNLNIGVLGSRKIFKEAKIRYKEIVLRPFPFSFFFPVLYISARENKFALCYSSSMQNTSWCAFSSSHVLNKCTVPNPDLLPLFVFKFHL